MLKRITSLYLPSSTFVGKQLPISTSLPLTARFHLNHRTIMRWLVKRPADTSVCCSLHISLTSYSSNSAIGRKGANLINYNSILMSPSQASWQSFTFPGAYKSSTHIFKILLIWERGKEGQSRGSRVDVNWGRGRISGRLHAERGAWHGVWSHNPEMVTWAEIKIGHNPRSQPGFPFAHIFKL